MPFDTASIGPGKPVLGRHISDLYTVLTGSMVDQPVTLANDFTVGGVASLLTAPTQPSHAVTKSYADGLITTHTGLANPHPQYLTIPLTQHLTFSPDNTYDIGASGVTRPRSIYVGTQVLGPSNVAYSFAANTGTGFGSTNPATYVGLWVNNVLLTRFENGTHRIGGAIGLGWTPTADPNSTGTDVALFRGGVGVLEQRSGTSPQSSYLYRTYTDASNYERMFLTGNMWGSHFGIGLQYAGTGAAKHLYIAAATSGTSSIIFETANADRWQINPAGHFLQMGTDGTLDIGSATANRPRNLYQAGGIYHSYNPGAGIANDGTNFERFRIEWGSNVMNIGTQAAGTGAARPIVFSAASNAIYMRPTGASNWVFHPGGYFGPETNNVYDIGTASLAVRTIYAGTSFVGPGALPTGGTTGQVLQKNTATSYDVSWATPSGGGLTLPLSQNLTFAPDAMYDIGTNPTTSRPRYLFLSAGVRATDILAPAALSLGGGGAWQWQISATGHVLAITDNTYDIGASAASRPRTIYAGTSFIGPGAVPTGGTAGQVLSKVDATNYNLAWITPTGGGGGLTLPLGQPLTFSPDATYDIGAATVNRPRHIHQVGYHWLFNPNDTFNERGSFEWYLNELYIQSYASGPGTSRNMRIRTSGPSDIIFDTANTARWRINSTGHLLAETDNTYDIGASGSRIRDVWVARDIQQNQAAPGSAFLGRTGIMGGTDPSYALRVNGNTYFAGTIGGFPSMSTSGSGSFGGPVTAQYMVAPDYRSSGVDLTISPNNTQRWVFAYVNGELRPTNDNQVDIGVAGTRPRNIYVGTQVLAANGTVTAPSYSFGAAPGLGIYERSGVALTFASGGVNFLDMQTSLMVLGPAPYFGWANADPTINPADVRLYRGAAGTLEQRNGANAQVLRVYNTYTDASNYERLTVQWAGNLAYLTTEKAGTGANRTLIVSATNEVKIDAQGVSGFRFNGAGMWSTTDSAMDIGQATTNRVKNIYQAGGEFHTYNPGAGILNDGTNYERVALRWISNNPYLYVEAGGTGVARSMFIGINNATSGNLNFVTGAVGRWVIQNAGHLIAVTDNAIDIGAAGATRPRTIYAATSFVGPGAVPTGGTAGQVLQKSTATNYDVGWVTNAGLTVPLGQNLTFTPDNTYDIGAAGASRARDLFLARDLVVGRNATVSGTLGVTGATTLAAVSATSITDSGTLSVTGTSTLAGLSATSSSISGPSNILTTTTYAISTATSGAAPFMIQAGGTGSGGGASMMSFHRPGSYAAYFGMDTDNVFKVGGWSMGAVAYRLVHEGLVSPILLDPKLSGPTGFVAPTNDLVNYMFGTTTVCTLPAAAGRVGQIRLIKAWAAATTVNSASANLMPPGAQNGTIVSSFVLAFGDSVTMYCDGTYWWVV